MSQIIQFKKFMFLSFNHYFSFKKDEPTVLSPLKQGALSGFAACTEFSRANELERGW